MRIAAGCDHAGFPLKRQLSAWLEEAGHQLVDLGTSGTGSVDYPEFGRSVGRAVAAGEVDLGLVICGTGIGISIAANKVPGVRAARCLSEYDARYARLHNDANVLALGARVVGEGLAESILATFLETAFEGGRHARRVGQLEGE